ncbi:MAG: hypothetical protein ACTS22_09490 [Phycisphaerales bacterium]
MIPENRFIELLARQASGEASREDLATLDRACEASAALRTQREGFLAALAAARSDDTADAPGPVLLRAYAIPTLRAAADADRPSRVSLLRVVFDSLRPAAGLRSGATADRQLMLEADGITADVFVRGSGPIRELRVLLEGDDAAHATVHLIHDTGSAAFDLDGDAWTARAPMGRARIEIRVRGRALVTDELALG